jgi:hypothetical protein
MTARALHNQERANTHPMTLKHANKNTIPVSLVQGRLSSLCLEVLQAEPGSHLARPHSKRSHAQRNLHE